MNDIELSAEDEWDIICFEHQVRSLEYEQVIEALVELYRINKIKDVMLKEYTENVTRGNY
jgi:hypothetical protein